MENYSVLMSVYNKVNPEFFEISIKSMLDQTVVTNDFVIVCDGPLTPELDRILDDYQAEHPEIFNILRLPNNVGVGAATNEGLAVCKNELVAKMDADDISIPERCEIQINKFASNPDLCVLGGYIEEFDNDPNKAFAIRSVPTNNEDIRHFARRRQPFNNVTVMYKRSKVLSVGGYRSLRRCEDYDMYLRLLHNGYYSENLSDVLVKVRVDKRANMRRASFSTLIGCVKSRWNAFRIGYSSFFDFLYCCIGELVILFCPGKIQQLIYSRFLRESCNEEDITKKE